MLNGGQIIDGEFSFSGEGMFCGINPSNGQILEPPFYNAEAVEVENAVKAATTAYKTYSSLPLEKRALFLDKIAEELTKNQEEIIVRCNLETGLPEGRLKGEIGRTTSQLQLFAEVIRDGSFLDIRIDTAGADIRRINIPLGPVAVFGASNFPLAFSVAGGDTVSALAAGCTVVFKANPGHPGTSEIVARSILAAADHLDIDAGVFSLIHDKSHNSGQILVSSPAIKAVGFTGSFTGGKALFDLANRRPEPIPVYAEMGSINPVFILPSALHEPDQLATGILQSVTMGQGQFCTNPGLLVIERSEAAKALITSLSAKFASFLPGPMLMTSIRQAYEQKTDTLSRVTGVEILACSPKTTSTECSASAMLMTTDVSTFLSNPSLKEEIFGPSTLIVMSDNPESTLEFAEQLEGQLTASVFCSEQELEHRTMLLDTVRNRVGRLIYNNFPTGVEVGYAMHHGGPYPATTAPDTTSVGTAAVSRFMRPVCYQGYPEKMLPEPLHNKNPKRIMRMINGKYLKIDI